MDALSEIHFKTVRTEIEGRFFSEEEADQLKREIDRRIITDPEIRAMAAQSWELLPGGVHSD